MADAKKQGGNVPKKPRNSGKPAKKKPGQIPVVKAGGGGKAIPWATIGAVAVVLLIVAGLAVYLVPKYMDQREVAKFTPSSSNPDPSDKIDGVEKIFYPAGQHVEPTQRVAYDKSPPFGGPHDAVWATCTGIVYPNALRTENAVHALEHGAVWITYNPATIAPGDLDTLKSKVEGEQYLLLSPYPDLDKPISLQSWGHQLKLDSAGDERVDQFIEALRRNSNTGVYPDNPQEAAYPEVGAECAAIPGAFDPSNPPPADVGPVPADAVPMTGAGSTQATDENGMGIPQPAPAG
ncbi:MAG: hypothetical protein C0482_25890 [Gordonia sp.]|uniref:DUF3105 domain-containing protein n=1 Tax=Gordonia rubripertincta TaxID=36822 RepID=A0ABT4N132_GORRU|nr:DUF3105 domain-containing protein [Gordonia rubripertincta]MBA4025795.1 hypothetical protein [Gordonia sp. (in: high G+C Gram-positive bacteria)]MCZ4552947.1 DUF3105 domain-containing protein [Gordonia rubripertincta]